MAVEWLRVSLGEESGREWQQSLRQELVDFLGRVKSCGTLVLARATDRVRIPIEVRDVDRLLIQQGHQGVVDHLETEEFAFVFISRLRRSWCEIHRWLFHLGEQDGEEEGDDGIVHLQDHLLVRADALSDEEKSALEFISDLSQGSAHCVLIVVATIAGDAKED